MSKTSEKVNQILSCYGSESPAILDKLYRLFYHGRLAGTGRLVILPIDQGFEHGPTRSFALNPAAYDPCYHFQLAVDAGCSAYAAPLGFLEAGARKFAGRVPLILKLNNADSLFKTPPGSAVTSSIEDALRLGCVGIGFTIYPGSSTSRRAYETLAQLAREAKKLGLLVVVWAYPRGEALKKEHEQALDVVAYAAHIAAQLGAHIIKVKPPCNRIASSEVTKVLQQVDLPSAAPKNVITLDNMLNEKEAELENIKGLYRPVKNAIKSGVEDATKSVAKSEFENSNAVKDAAETALAPLETHLLRDRVRHILQAAFNGRRIVIFSGGPAKDKSEFLNEVHELARGGSFGSIVGRNAFTRPHNEAVELLQKVMEIYKKIG